MATRSLTARYEAFRGQTQRRDRTPRSESVSGQQGLLSDSANVTDVVLTPEMPPQWIDILDTIKKDMTKVKDNLRSLSILHSKRLQVSFGDEAVAEQERDIEILTQEITKLLRRSEANVKRIASAGVSSSSILSNEDRVARINVMRAIAADLQEQSRKFRQTQKTFLHNLRQQEQLGDEFGFSDGKSGTGSVSLEEAVDRGLTAEQLQQLQELQYKSDQRYADIVKIAQSINDLASLFRELNVLVIEQGSLLDRIDYNIEQTSIHVQKANVELKAADDYSKRAYTFKCLVLLLIIVVILLAVLIYKKSK